MGEGLRRLLPILVLVTCVDVAFAQMRYATVYGYGLDKWATAWLLTRHVEPDSKLDVVDRRSALPDEATGFDVPGSRYVRTGERSAFAAVIDARSASASSVERRLARVVHRIEVAYWQTDNSPETLSVEHAFRRLQRSTERVPAECYLRFFDSVAAAMRVTRAYAALPRDRLLTDCAAAASPGADELAPASEAVTELAIEDALAAIRAGRDVVFVDVREPQEFAETRIPGAINIPIRWLDEAAVARVADADLVISYCVKDFRGFEMAKLFGRAGVEHSAIMRPYGLKGWVSSGLPTAGSESLPESQALAELDGCVASGHCPESSP